MVWARRQGQWKGKNLVFLGGGRKKVTHCIFGRNFLSPCTTIALGTENYPNIDCSDDVAVLLPCLDL